MTQAIKVNNRKARRSMVGKFKRFKRHAKNTIGAFKEHNLDIMRKYNLEKNAENTARHTKNEKQ